MTTKNKQDWIKGKCPICGKTFEYLITYDHQLRPHTPITCGKFDCLQEANKKGLLYKAVQEG